jgi:branched-chain amino acid transport system substrate-binding protein
VKAVAKSKVLISLATLALLTGCTTANSGSSSSSSSSSSKSGDSILIGVLSPTTGSSAKMGIDMNNAIQMAADELNAKGGVNGKKIKLDFADGAADPQTAAAAANKLVADGVVAVVGGYASGAVLPASGVFHKAGIPMVVTAANSAKIPAQGYNDIFLLNGTTTAQAQTAADYMTKKLNGKKIAIINDNSAYAKDLALQTQQAVQADGGTVVALDAVNPQETDFTTELTKLKNLKPDATYWTAYYAAGGLFIKQFKQIGVSGAIGVGDGANDPTLIQVAGASNAEGTFVTTSPTPQFEASAATWLQNYKTKFKQDPGPYSALSYDGLRVMANAISEAKSTDKSAVIKELSATNGFDTFGGPVSFKADGELAHTNFIVLTTKNGQFALPQ